jgi:hypothetical protein
MTLYDKFGAPLSSGNRRSVDAFNDAAALMLGFFADPLATIDAALEADPAFVMGHCFRAGLFLISSEAGCEPELKRILTVLEPLEKDANDRERGHIAAIRAWSRRDFHHASEEYGRVVIDFPRDIVAMQFAHQCDFLLGQSTMLRDRVAQVLPAWSEADADYGYMLGMQAFGLEECGHYARAEEFGRRAVSLQPKDAWAHHAVAHVCEMQGRTEEGIRWLTGGAGDWSKRNMVAFHNWWHLALYHLEIGDTAKVLSLYDEVIRPQSSQVAMEMVDATSMLWRLYLRGVDVGGRWTELADIYEGWVDHAYYPFNDAHAMMSFVATGRDAAARRLMAALEGAAGARDSSAIMIRDIGLPVVRAIRAFGDRDYSSACEMLTDVRKRAAGFGGSNAQRDVLSLTLLEGAIRAGDVRAATALTNERKAAKPASPFVGGLMKRVSSLPDTRARICTAA